eukprot:Filipodium_phascolosomae@DN77_c0_g1_i1.p1
MAVRVISPSKRIEDPRQFQVPMPLPRPPFSPTIANINQGIRPNLFHAQRPLPSIPIISRGSQLKPANGPLKHTFFPTTSQGNTITPVASASSNLPVGSFGSRTPSPSRPVSRQTPPSIKSNFTKPISTVVEPPSAYGRPAVTNQIRERWSSPLLGRQPPTNISPTMSSLVAKNPSTTTTITASPHRRIVSSPVFRASSPVTLNTHSPVIKSDSTFSAVRSPYVVSQPTTPVLSAVSPVPAAQNLKGGLNKLPTLPFSGSVSIRQQSEAARAPYPYQVPKITTYVGSPTRQIAYTPQTKSHIPTQIKSYVSGQIPSKCVSSYSNGSGSPIKPVSVPLTVQRYISPPRKNHIHFSSEVSSPVERQDSNESTIVVGGNLSPGIPSSGCSKEVQNLE